MTRLIVLAFAALATACGQSTAPPAEPAASPSGLETARSKPQLEAILAAQPPEAQARYVYRHPQQTLEYFGIEPGMNVVEALPGGGWYTKILLPYLGTDGALAGADYALEMWPKFGMFSQEMLDGKKTWVAQWTSDAEQWRGPDGAQVSAFVFGSMPDSLNGWADAVLFIRALHNLHRFESDGGFLTSALANAYDALKPGGIVGIVQHEAPETATDEWADGSRGYLKQARLIERLENAGFEFVGSSDINQNPLDQPTEQDFVWRLPPSLATSAENAQLREEMLRVGESNRMTLKFRKPL